MSPQQPASDTLVFSVAVNGYHWRYRRLLDSQRQYALRHGYTYLLIDRPLFSLLGEETAWLKLPAALVALEVSPSDQAASYLSVCSEFDPNQTGYAINYDNCLIRTAIEGPANFSVQVPNAVNSLIAVRWYYEAGSEPVYSFWTRERDGDIFSIR